MVEENRFETIHCVKCVMFVTQREMEMEKVVGYPINRNVYRKKNNNDSHTGPGLSRCGSAFSLLGLFPPSSLSLSSSSLSVASKHVIDKQQLQQHHQPLQQHHQQQQLLQQH